MQQNPLLAPLLFNPNDCADRSAVYVDVFFLFTTVAFAIFPGCFYAAEPTDHIYIKRHTQENEPTLAPIRPFSAFRRIKSRKANRTFLKCPELSSVLASSPFQHNHGSLFEPGSPMLPHNNSLGAGWQVQQQQRFGLSS